MRRKLFALIALLAVALPASAFAGHRSHHNSADARGSHCERPVRSGYVTVDNPNRVTMQVIIDGRNMGSVRAGDTARFGPLDEGQHKVAAKYVCNKRSLTRRILKERVWVDARRPVRINLPYADLAIVEVSNEWIEGMDISVDGRTVDYVQANGRTAFIAPTYASVSLIEPAGTRAMTARIDGHGFSSRRATPRSWCGTRPEPASSWWTATAACSATSLRTRRSRFGCARAGPDSRCSSAVAPSTRRSSSPRPSAT